MQSGYQTSTLLLASTLAVVSLWANGHAQNIWTGLSQNAQTQGKQIDLAVELKPVGLDIVFVFIIAFIAGLSDDAGKMSIAVVVGAWLLFLMHKKYPSTNPLATGLPANPVKGGTKGAKL